MDAARPKYALLENERRFLVFEPPDLSAAPPRRIDDLYLDGGRLRLRRIGRVDGTLEFKLGKKYGSDDPCSEPITNLYLTEAEYALFRGLPGARLAKRRHTLAWNGRTYGLDVFEGPLAGLVICEAEAPSAAAIRALAFPPWAAVEVTADPVFAGASLARMTAAALAGALDRVGRG